MLEKKLLIPLYHQLAEKLREEIEDAKWAIGTLIPSETELCKQYKISRGTVRQAISELIKDGLVYTNRGQGTFVSKPGSVWPVSTFYCFNKETEKNRVEFTRKEIERKAIFPDELIKKKMNLTEESKVYKMVFMVLTNKEPLALQVSYLTEKLFPQLEKQNLVTIAPYETLIKKYKIKITRVRETFEPILSNKIDSKKLKISPNSLSLLVKRTAWTGNTIFEYRSTIVKSSECHYSVELI